MRTLYQSRSQTPFGNPGAPGCQTGVWAREKWTLWQYLAIVGLIALILGGGAVATASAQDDVPTPAPVTAAPKTAPQSDGIAGFFRTIGMIGVLILVLSLVLVAMIVWLLLDLRGNVAMPLDFIELFEGAVNKRRFKDAFDLAKAEGSMIGRVLTAGMTRMQYGLQEARDAAEAMTDNLKTRKDHVVSYMATIGTLGPLLGLVGTVYGMIMSFGELGKGGTPNPSALAGGISHALYVTLLGISLSLPAIFFYSFFRNRISRTAIDVSLMADDLLTQMFHSSRKPGADASATGKTAASSAAAPAKAAEA